MSIKDLCQNYQTIGNSMQPNTEARQMEMAHKNLMMFISLYIPDLAHKHYIFEYITGLCTCLNEMKLNHAQREELLCNGVHTSMCLSEDVFQEPITAVSGTLIKYHGHKWISFFDSPEHFHVQNVISNGEETFNSMTGKINHNPEYFYIKVDWQ